MAEPNPLITIIEDEPQMSKFLHTALTAQGSRTVIADTARGGLVAITTQNPEVILLDLGLPDRDGIEIIKEVREWSRIPIIVISARGRESDKITALDAGADDYLTKPFGVNELLARIRVSLRHSIQAASPAGLPLIDLGELHLDLERRKVEKNGQEIHLTPIEYKLLVYMVQNAGKVLTHRQILREVWGASYAGQTHYLRVFMTQLRRKIEDDPARPRLLLTEPGVGYRVRDVD